jgi:hypothetical protein
MMTAYASPIYTSKYRIIPLVRDGSNFAYVSTAGDFGAACRKLAGVTKETRCHLSADQTEQWWNYGVAGHGGTKPGRTCSVGFPHKPPPIRA